MKERRSDIPLLVSHFLKQNSKKQDMPISHITKSAMTTIMEYGWPGNVRELKNLMERIVVLNEKHYISTDDLPMHMKASTERKAVTELISDDGICLQTAVTEFEKRLITQSLEKTNWVKNKAAKLLHLNRTTLVEKIKRYNLEQATA